MTFEEMPPVMRELFRMLPPTGSEWPLVERLRWLRAFEAVSRLIFKDDGAQILIDPIAPEPRETGQA